MPQDAGFRVSAAIDRLAKWRVLLTGWQLGTRQKGDPEGDAVRDHREATLLLQVQVGAFVMLLTKKGVITDREWADALADEADTMNAALERRFPGVTASRSGLTFDQRAAETMKGWRP